MDVITWGAVGAFLSSIIAVSGWQWRLASRMTKTDAAAEGASLTAAATKIRMEDLSAEFADFRVHVATEYANRDAMVQLETRLVDAINRLGDRLDKVFARPGL